MRAIVILTAILALLSADVSAQDRKPLNLHAGIRLQKTVGFYAINGIAAELNSPRILGGKPTFGLNYLSSRMGSAFLNNAIACHELQLSAIRYFRPNKSLKPLFRLNTGFAWAGYGSDKFSEIPNSSALLSLEPGVAYDFKKPLRISLSLGYNLISGTGDKGYGMVWPVYVQCSGLYRFSLPAPK